MTLALSIRQALGLTACALISSASLVFGFAGTAHAHGTFTPPIAPQAPGAHHHPGPFSVLHEGPLPAGHPGPFSVLHQAG